MTEIPAEHQLQPVRMERWFLPLPEPLPLPDGWSHTEKIGNRPDRQAQPDDVAATVTVHQVVTTAARTMAVYAAVNDVVSRSAGLSETLPQPPGAGNDPLAATITVVEAVTTNESPDSSRDPSGAADRPPREDSLMRCLRLITDLARTYCVSTQTPLTIPTYERLPPLVYCYTAPGVKEWRTLGSHRQELTRSTGPWTGPGLILLEHANFSDPSVGTEVATDPGTPFYQAMSALRTAKPRFLYRERYIDAQRALQVDGAYGQTVALAVTAAEVLIDWLLALLMWEGKEPTDNLAAIFAEGKTLRRLTTELPQRLGGTWSTETPGPVENWYQKAYRLRHRIVDGGHLPSRPTARAALDATHTLERHAMDRIVEQRSTYPRTTLMTVAEEGLRRRAKWTGKIKQFAETTAATEPSWSESFRRWYDNLETIRLATLGTDDPR